MRQLMIVLLAGVGGLLSITSPASSKEPTHAVLENAAQLSHAPAGQRVTVAWTLDTPARFPEPEYTRSMRSPTAMGIYVRVRGRADSAPLTVAGRPADPATRGYPRGRYVAELTVPPGGLSAIEIGVRQWWAKPGGAPILREDPIAVSNDPLAGVGAAAARGVGGGPSWGMLVGVIGGLVLLLGAVEAQRARRTLA
jgi:hypothetical protein